MNDEDMEFFEDKKEYTLMTTFEDLVFRTAAEAQRILDRKDPGFTIEVCPTDYTGRIYDLEGRLFAKVTIEGIELC
jgi:hypothetical protein